MKRLTSPRMFESFEYPDFRWLWTGSFANFMAMGMQMMARGWLVLRLSDDSPLALSFVMIAFALPMTCVSLIGGALADRIPRKYILMAVQAGNALMTGLLATLDLTGLIRFWLGSFLHHKGRDDSLGRGHHQLQIIPGGRCDRIKSQRLNRLVVQRGDENRCDSSSSGRNRGYGNAHIVYQANCNALRGRINPSVFDAEILRHTTGKYRRIRHQTILIIRECQRYRKGNDFFIIDK